MSHNFVLLDGGMGKTLEAQGAPFRQPEWSALALMEAPDAVLRAHLDFLAAGADVLTTNNYAVVPFHLGLDRFLDRGGELTALSGELARQAADTADQPVLVAGSIPPLYGSYEPDNFVPETADAHLKIVVDALADHVDLFLAETQSCLAEARASLRAAGSYDLPRWVAYTLSDDHELAAPVLRSGESVTEAVELAVAEQAEAVLFNCSQPEQMLAAVTEARLVSRAISVGVYANAFEEKRSGYAANRTILGHRHDLDTVGYRRFAEQWLDAGASIVGGCCGIMPDHIEALADLLSND